MIDLKIVVGKNLSELRKEKGLTQSELGEKFGYSDKAVSKWEQGSTLPDLQTLNDIAAFYNVTLDYLTHESNAEKKEKYRLNNKDDRNRKIIICCLMGSFELMLATITYAYLMMKNNYNYWLAFLWSIPLMGLTMVALNRRYFRRKLISFVSLTTLLWGLIICCFIQVYLSVSNTVVWPIFLLGIPTQLILVFATFAFKSKTKTPSKKKKKA